MTRRVRRIRLTSRFTMLITIIIAVVLGCYVLWSVHAQNASAEDKALAEARVLGRELDAIWDYINDQQDRINYNSDGMYDFKGVYCTVAAKNIAQRFMRQSDYVIRYARENPRTAGDAPDDFEQAAIDAYRDDGAREYYQVTAFNGSPALRYSTVLLAEQNCLECHGEPAGELDEVGYLKEGMQYGDLAGLTSIVIPLSSYQAEIGALVLRDVSLAAILVTFVGGAVWMGIRLWVARPLLKINGAAQRIGQGEFDAGLDEIKAKGEMNDLVGEIAKMASDLEALYSSLETKVSERTAELEHANVQLQGMNEALRQANAYKSNFLAIVSHELRTPLTSIIAFTDILARNPRDDDEACMIAEVKGSASSLLAMINNVIDAAKIEAGKFEMHYEDVDVVDVVSAVEGALSPLAEKKGVTLISNVAGNVPVVKSDRNALYKVLMNLTGNAVKFTDEGGSVLGSSRAEFADVIEGDGAGARGRVLVISVADTGAGIAREDLGSIFERFVQPDSSLSRRYGGSGLGLSLVRDLVDALGGSVEVESEVGSGSRFTVRLPLVASDELPFGERDVAAGEEGESEHTYC